MPAISFSTIDYVLIGIYVVFTIVLGLRFARKHENAEEYFLGGRRFTWPLIGLSLYASNMSSSSMIGLSGAAYQTGVSVYNYEWMAALILVFFAIFLLPFYLRSQVYTMPEYLERRYDVRSRYYFSGLTLLATIFIDTAGTLYAGAIVIKTLFPAVPFVQAAIVLAMIAGIYTVAGGLAAVVYTDAVQAVLLTIGAVLVTWLAFDAVGSWDAVMQVTPHSMMSLVRPLDDSFMPWLGMATGVPILGFYFWCTNQFMVQRVLGAKNLDHGRRGALFAGLLKLPIVFIMVLPGTMARVLYPDLETADMVFPTLMFDLLPVGVKGLVAAGLLAAIMSSIDSTLNSGSTLLTMDFFRKLRPRTSSEGLMWAGRVFTVVFMVLSAAWAPVILRFPSLFHYLQSILGYISPPIVACFVIGLFWRRANGHGAFACLMVGFIVAAAMISMKVAGVQNWITSLHFLYIPPLLLAICSLTLVVVSLMTPPPGEEAISAYIWTPNHLREDRQMLADVPWHRNYLVLSALLLLLMAAIVGLFW